MFWGGVLRKVARQVPRHVKSVGWDLRVVSTVECVVVAFQCVVVGHKSRAVQALESKNNVF
jgi:hypothetical protein